MANYVTREQELCAAIEAARADVEKATFAYRRGGSCERVNEANERLLRSHEASRCHRDGRIAPVRER